jgi:hypothetical protein
MVDLVVLQSVSYVAAAIGVCIAAIYYVMTLRVQQANMKHTLETRQAQFFMQIYEVLGSVEFQKSAFELRKMEWKDFEDWDKKYHWRANEDAYAKFVAAWRYCDALGFLVKNKLVDPVKIYDIQGNTIITGWDRYREIIVRLRERGNIPEFQQHFEYLYNEMVKIREQRGNPIASTLKAP